MNTPGGYMPGPNGKPPELTLSEVIVGGGGTGPGTGGCTLSLFGPRGRRVLFPVEPRELPRAGREAERLAFEARSLSRMDVPGWGYD